MSHYHSNDYDYSQELEPGVVIDFMGLLMRMRAIRDGGGDPVWVAACQACIDALVAEDWSKRHDHP